MSIEDDRDRYFRDWEFALYDGDDTGNYSENPARLLLATLKRTDNLRLKLEAYLLAQGNLCHKRQSEACEEHIRRKKLKGNHRIQYHMAEKQFWYDAFDEFKQEFISHSLLASRPETQINKSGDING